jgi:hypothetical protein
MDSKVNIQIGFGCIGFVAVGLCAFVSNAVGIVGSFMLLAIAGISEPLATARKSARKLFAKVECVFFLNCLSFLLFGEVGRLSNVVWKRQVLNELFESVELFGTVTPVAASRHLLPLGSTTQVRIQVSVSAMCSQTRASTERFFAVSPIAYELFNDGEIFFVS